MYTGVAIVLMNTDASMLGSDVTAMAYFDCVSVIVMLFDADSVV